MIIGVLVQEKEQQNGLRTVLDLRKLELPLWRDKEETFANWKITIDGLLFACLNGFASNPRIPSAEFRIVIVWDTQKLGNSTIKGGTVVEMVDLRQLSGLSLEATATYLHRLIAYPLERFLTELTSTP